MQLNFVGTPNTTGVGFVRMHLLRAMHELGFDVSLFPTEHKTECEYPADTALVTHLLANMVRSNLKAPSFRVDALTTSWLMAGKGLHCAMPFFEYDAIAPHMRHLLSALDVICVPSQWGRQILLKEIIGLDPGRVIVTPLGVNQKIFFPATPDNALAKSPATKFINVGRFERRKGQEFLIEAFNRAFAPADNVALILACDNPLLDKAGETAWKEAARRTPLGNRIYWPDKRPATQQELAAWMQSCDCGVFPSRAEGWNMELLEVLACGKAAIATNYSAHTEFINAANARLIEIDELETPPLPPVGYPGLGLPGRCAALGLRQMEQLVEHMRSVHRAKMEGRLGANDEGLRTAQRLTWEACAMGIAQALAAAK